MNCYSSQANYRAKRQAQGVSTFVALMALLWAALGQAQTAPGVAKPSESVVTDTVTDTLSHTATHTLTDSGTPAGTASADTRRDTAIATVDIESTIRGNPEQPKTIYVLPWQDSVARIKMSGDEAEPTEAEQQPLDRDDFLRFINANQNTASDSESPQSKQ